MLKPRKALALAALIMGLFTYTFHEQAIAKPGPSFIGSEGRVVQLQPVWKTECLEARAFSYLKLPRAERANEFCTVRFRNAGILEKVERRWTLFLSGAFATLVLSLLAVRALLNEPLPVIVRRGPKVLRGRAGRRMLARTAKSESRGDGEGLQYPPGLPISRERETRHVLITGAVGSGKTQTLQWLVHAAIQRGDKMLILDTKGDMTATLPSDFTLIAPPDDRSAAWDIAADCSTRQEARELAIRFIPSGSDPMWAEAARELLVACIVSLQGEKPGKWNWADLHQRTLLDAAGLKMLGIIWHPAVLQILGEPNSKTALSIVTTFRAHLAPIEALAEAWSHADKKAFSFRRWLFDDKMRRPVILQRDGRYPQLTQAWTSAVVSLLAAQVASPVLRESRDRRVWLFLDEFPQLQAMDEFASLLDLGRSKGVCVVLTAQDMSQVRFRYGRDRADSWQALIGTHIIGQVNAGDAAEALSRSLGQQECEQMVRSRSHTRGQSSISFAPHRFMRPVMTASELGSELGRKDGGLRMLMAGFGEDYVLFDMPILELTDWRPAHLPAAWTTATVQALEPPSQIDPPAPPADVPPRQPLLPGLTQQEIQRLRARWRKD